MRTKSLHFLVLCFILISFASTKYPTQAHSTAQEQIYLEDFEDGVAEGWDLEQGWEIISQGINHVLFGQGHAWANSNQSFQDYHLSFRLKLQKGEIHLVHHMNNAGRYFIGFNTAGSMLNKQYWPDQFLENLQKHEIQHPLNKWHQVEIISQDATLTFIVNGITEWTYDDPEPLSLGSFAFETLDNSQAYIDDVSVEIPGKTSPAQTLPLESLTWVRTGGPLGGLGYDVRMDPINPDKMFVTDAYAGIFMSLDGGQTWSPSNSGIIARDGPTGDVIPIFSLTIDPNNSDIIWAGFQNKSGIYKSTDGGQTWQLKISGVVERHGISFRGFSVEPGNSNVVYAAAEISSWADGREEKQGREFDMTQGVVYQSIDGGESWQAIWRGNNLARYIWINPENIDILYISTGIFDREAYNSDPETGDPGGEGVLKSINGGKVWEYANNGLNNLYVGSLFMHPSNPDILLAGTGNNQYSEYNGIYLSKNGGQSWEHVLREDNITSVEFSITDPSIAYAGSAEAIYMSSDGGKTWQLVSGGGENGWGPPGVRAGFPIDFQIDPRNPNRIFANEYGGGNFLSQDGGKTWTDASQGYTGAEMRAITIAPNEPGLVLAAARSGAFISFDGGTHWEGLNNPQVASLEWNAIKFDPRDTQKIIGGSNWGNVLAKSNNRGRTWTIILSFESEKVGFSDIAFSPSHMDFVYASTAGYNSAGSFGILNPGKGVYVSSDGGSTWQPANDEKTQGAHVSSLAVHPHDPATVYAASSTNGLLLTQNGGQSWVVVKGGLPQTLAASVAINPDDPQIIFAGFFNQAIYRSTDGGVSWVRAANGMPPEASIESILFDPTNPSEILYAADTLSGVYLSTNGGNLWQTINNGLTMRSVRRLAISDDGNHLYAATNGGGVFRLDLSGQPPKPAQKPVVELPTPTSIPTSASHETTSPSKNTPTFVLPTSASTISAERTSNSPVQWLIPTTGIGLLLLGVLSAFLIIHLKKNRTQK